MSTGMVILETLQCCLIGVILLNQRHLACRLSAMEQHHDYVLHLRNKHRVTDDPVTTISKHDRIREPH